MQPCGALLVGGVAVVLGQNLSQAYKRARTACSHALLVWCRVYFVYVQERPSHSWSSYSCCHRLGVLVRSVPGVTSLRLSAYAGMFVGPCSACMHRSMYKASMLLHVLCMCCLTHMQLA